MNHKPISMVKEMIKLVLTTPTSTAADAFENVQNLGTAYQIPSDKTFYATRVTYHAIPTAVGYMRVFQADTEDASTLNIQNFRVDGETNGNIPINYQFAPGKFITGDPTTANEFDDFYIFGYEL